MDYIYKLLFSFLLLLSFSSYSYAQIAIEEFDHQFECRNCYGKLVVSNGVKTDTIFGGQWGNPPNYEIKKIKNKQILIVDYDYMLAGGYQFKSLKILSLDKSNFLKEIFKKKIILYSETHRNENNVPTNFLYNNDPLIKIGDSIEITSRITIKKCPEVEEMDCDTLLELEEIEYFILER